MAWPAVAIHPLRDLRRRRRHRLPPARAANLGRARGDHRIAFIDTRDVADVAAAIPRQEPGDRRHRPGEGAVAIRSFVVAGRPVRELPEDGTVLVASWARRKCG